MCEIRIDMQIVRVTTNKKFRVLHSIRQIFENGKPIFLKYVFL